MFTSNSTKLNSVSIIAYNSNVHFARNVPFSQTRSHMESKDRPSPIDETKMHSSDNLLGQAGSYLKCAVIASMHLLEFTLARSAAQMWMFARLLPLLNGHCIPSDDEHWENFLLMMKIADYLFSPKVTSDDAAYFQVGNNYNYACEPTWVNTYSICDRV